ncbi:MAG: hypothetical protein AAFP13_04175 [Pseudomonadota bacterium]
MDDDRQARPSHRFHVAQDRAGHDLPFPRELHGGLPTAILQKKQDLKKTRCPHGGPWKMTEDVMVPDLSAAGQGKDRHEDI